MSLVSRRIPLVALAVLALASTTVTARAQDTGEVAILAVEAIDRAGRTVGNMDAEELSASANGEDLTILGLGEPGPWEVVVYVDQQLTGSRSILLFLEALADQADELTELGDVQIVLADEEPTSMLRTRDPDILRQALLDLALRSAGEHAFQYGRNGFLRRLTGDAEETAESAGLELAEELQLLRQRQDDLIHWISSHGRTARPRAMLLLNDSLTLDPYDFYRQYLASEAGTLIDLGEPPSSEALAQTLTSYGWTLVPVIVPPDPEADSERVSLRTNQSIGFRIGFGGDDEDEEGEEIAPEDLGLLEGRDEGLQTLATSTGGFLAGDPASMPGALERLSNRRELRLAGQPLPGVPLTLAVSSIRPGVEILAPSWVGGAPEAIAEVRIRRSLAGGGDAGTLPMRARITVDPERLATQPADLGLLVDLSELPASDSPIPLRVSVGIHRQDGDLLLRHHIVEASLSEGTTWSWDDELPIPPSTDAAIVVVHDLSGDLWGENFAEFITVAEAEAAVATPLPEVASTIPVGPALRLVPLPANARTGKVRVRSESRPDVDEVIFMLDGERVGVRRRSPFDLRIDLGQVPQQRSIIAIAYDDAGVELGRDGLVVNEATSTFWVHITEPRPSKQVGPVDIVTSVKIPDNRRLEGVDYYWNDQKIDSTLAAPHRSRVLIPIDRPAGFIRVVATLDDGTTAEDVVLMNTPRFETEITVELVELYVVVTDRQGRPVRGLGSSDFRVREEQEVQEVESFAIAGDLPLTLGLAIDSSLSLFKKLPDVQKAAGRFVSGLRDDRDRAFLVGFGSTPRVVQSTTGDLSRIGRAIDSLEPSGNTAVWQAITLSLDQLNQEPGRKALVVFYDGDDEDEQYSFRKTMELARRSLIPVYLIVMNDEAARTQGKGFAVRSRIAKLDELARTGGGRVFFVRTDEDLTPIFDEIGEELRSHYLLTYYPQRPLANPEWRPIQVEVTRSDLEARTISGYGGG